MPVHPEMICGEEAYEPAIQRLIETIGTDRWNALPRNLQEQIRQGVIDEERQKLNAQFRKYYA